MVAVFICAALFIRGCCPTPEQITENKKNSLGRARQKCSNRELKFIEADIDSGGELYKIVCKSAKKNVYFEYRVYAGEWDKIILE